MHGKQSEPIFRLMGLIYRSHPWHGIEIGEQAPETVHAYIEIVPSDTVKYELDKETGILKVDRPQKFSNVTPCLYGLIPQTYCGPDVAELCRQDTGNPDIEGDGDPLDICVLSEKVFSRGDFLLHAIPIGGIRMLDRNEADDKILAVMRDDAIYGDWRDLNDCPQKLLDRLRHYFLTYKQAPDSTEPNTRITKIYGREEAIDTIRRSMADYRRLLGNLDGALSNLIHK